MADLTLTAPLDALMDADTIAAARGVLGITTILTPAYAATINVDGLSAPGGGRLVIRIGSMTGNLLLANPTNAVDEQIFEYELTQNATGGWATSLDTKFDIPTSSSLSSPINASVNIEYASPSRTSLLVVKYRQSIDKYRVVSFLPGYASS